MSHRSWSADGLFAALGESHAAGQSGHLRADARPLGAGLLDGRRRVQRPHARDARVGRFAYRPSAFYWWNYPVTDYARPILMQGPVYGLDTTLTTDDLCGFVSNPMEHGEASKLALYGVADYTWNTAAYNPIDNWERGLAELVPEAREAYRTFAIHSCDTETGYRRDESWETETFRIADYTPGQAAALREEFGRVVAAPGVLEERCANRELLAELRPWLAEFRKLGERGLRTLDLIACYETGDDAAFWSGYVRNRMSAADRSAYEAHKSGTMKLQPFYEQAMDDMAAGFFTRLTGDRPASARGIGSFPTPRHDAEPPDARPRPRDFLHFGPCAAGRRLDRRRSGNPARGFRGDDPSGPELDRRCGLLRPCAARILG